MPNTYADAKISIQTLWYARSQQVWGKVTTAVTIFPSHQHIRLPSATNEWPGVKCH